MKLLLRRLAAAAYDSVLLAALFFCAAFLLIALRGGKPIPALSLWFELCLWVLGFLFCGWFWTHGGQTLGLRAWRLRVVATGSAPLNWRRSLARYLLALPSWLSIVGIFWSLFDPQGRAWHEIVTHTGLVVISKRGPAF
ncbi:MAG: RDD family protein [Nevskiales bacterium]